MTQILNEIPVLDKGYVAKLSFSMSRDMFLSLQKEFLLGKQDPKFLDIPVIHLKIKCPLFVQMTFPEYGINYLVSRSVIKPEAYVPNVSEVNAMSLEASEAIQADIERTTEALLLNPKAYQMEHCNLFVSQVISPISVYNVLVVNGTLSQWIRYISQKNLPTPIESYRKAIESIIVPEYDFIKEMGVARGK